jgi:hypothetical protein
LNDGRLQTARGKAVAELRDERLPVLSARMRVNANQYPAGRFGDLYRRHAVSASGRREPTAVNKIAGRELR